MKLIKQENFNECGISCANMLINYYYHCNNNFRPQLLSQTHLSEFGLSLYELEQLCLKYNIELESYQMTNEEFMNLNHHSSPVILMLNNNDVNHYIVAFVGKKTVKIYDPSGQKYVLNKQEFLTKWTGYICFAKKINKWMNIFNFKNSKSLFKIHPFIPFTLLLLELTQFAVNLIVSWFISQTINLSSSQIFGANIIKLGILYVFVVIINCCFNYFNNQIKLFYYSRLNKQLNHLYFEYLIYKKPDFYKFYSVTQILKYWQFAQQILNFKLFYWSGIISKLILMIVTMIILLSTIPSFWLPIIIYLFVISIFALINLNINRQHYHVHLQNIDYLDKNLIDAFAMYSSNHFFDEKKVILHDAAKTLSNHQSTTFYNHDKSNAVTTLFQFINYILQFFLLIYLWKISVLTTGLVIFILNIFNMFCNSANDFVEGIQNRVSIKPLFTNLMAFVNTNNLTSTPTKINWSKPEFITFNKMKLPKSLLIDTNSLSNHPLIKSILSCYDPLQQVAINSVWLSDLNDNVIHENVIYIDETYHPSWKTMQKILSDESCLKYLQKLNFDDSTMSYNNFHIANRLTRIILILLGLTLCKNKIICFNNVFQLNIDEALLTDIYDLLNIIKCNNYLISNSDNKKLFTCYDCQI